MTSMVELKWHEGGRERTTTLMADHVAMFFPDGDDHTTIAFVGGSQRNVAIPYSRVRDTFHRASAAQTDCVAGLG